MKDFLTVHFGEVDEGLIGVLLYNLSDAGLNHDKTIGYLGIGTIAGVVPGFWFV